MFRSRTHKAAPLLIQVADRALIAHQFSAGYAGTLCSQGCKVMPVKIHHRAVSIGFAQAFSTIFATSGLENRWDIGSSGRRLWAGNLEETVEGGLSALRVGLSSLYWPWERGDDGLALCVVGENAGIGSPSTSVEEAEGMLCRCAIVMSTIPELGLWGIPWMKLTMHLLVRWAVVAEALHRPAVEIGWRWRPHPATRWGWKITTSCRGKDIENVVDRPGRRWQLAASYGQLRVGTLSFEDQAHLGGW